MDSTSYTRLRCAASYCWPSTAVELTIVCSISALKEYPSISGSELNPILNPLFVICPLTKPVTGQHLAQGSRVTPKYLFIADSFEQPLRVADVRICYLAYYPSGHWVHRASFASYPPLPAVRTSRPYTTAESVGCLFCCPCRPMSRLSASHLHPCRPTARRVLSFNFFAVRAGRCCALLSRWCHSLR